MTTTQLTVVVPCYNEGSRLDESAFAALLDGPELRVLLVNDGSTDNTAARLESLQARWPDRVEVLSLGRNGGKAEAVRQGLLRAIAAGARAVAYLDADMATPPAELHRLWQIMRERGAGMVMGARIALLGTNIERRAIRHYLGRIFATAASQILDLRVYDTQCGAKILRCSPALLAALDEPFISRWAFDVELIGRLLTARPGLEPLRATDIIEVPLASWVDIPGSKLRATGMARTALELARVALDVRRRRRGARDGGSGS